MRLSWNEIRARSARFSEEWKGASYEKGESQSFYNDFFSVFGVKRRSVARYEEHVKKLNDQSGFIDLFWPGVLIVEQKSAGRNLEKAYSQAGEYFDALTESEKPRYILVSDFQNFELHDLDEREILNFRLVDLPQHVEKFAFILGIQKRSFEDQNPVNIEAAELVGNLHEALRESGYQGEDLEKFLVRLVFCLFADDTGIFEPRDIFLDFLEGRTAEDGSDLGGWLTRIFQVLDTPVEKRSTNLDEDLQQFPYVNGRLFSGAARIPDFNTEMRKALLRASRFDWSPISPAIFGSLFQSVLSKEERRTSGAHYTTEKNIMKVVSSLFLDSLREEFKRLLNLKTDRKRRLEEMKARLGKLRFLDPACGCGNFLVIAYREIRLLELDLLKELNKRNSQMVLDATDLSEVDVDQFYGIEIGEFAAKIAETAMWMMDHVMNNRLSLEFGQNYARIPLTSSASILNANALRVDWNTVLPAKSVDYVFGNPPFVGKHLQTTEQEKDMSYVFGSRPGAGILDYVAAWYLKVAEYVSDYDIPIAFVSTNSITQGEQVAALWEPLLQEFRFKIQFAHRTFKWGSDSRGKAQVHCVIIGFAKNDSKRKKLFDYPDINGEPDVLEVENINPYLIAEDDVLVRGVSRPVCAVPQIVYGSKPVDDGHFLFTEEEKSTFLADCPAAAPFLHRLVSAREFLHGINRWCLWLKDADPGQLSKLEAVVDRVKLVKAYRLNSSKSATREAANRATEFAEIRQPNSSYIVVPLHTSENRDYVPFGFFHSETIVHNSCACIPGAGLYEFAVLSSAMHMAWMKHLCGRIKSDFRYSNKMVYNTFVWPDVTGRQKKNVENLAEEVLKARSRFPDSTLSDLYDPDLMPSVLRKAHIGIDKAIDKLYKANGFSSERLRVEHLFSRYNELIHPLSDKFSDNRKAKSKKPKK